MAGHGTGLSWMSEVKSARVSGLSVCHSMPTISSPPNPRPHSSARARAPATNTGCCNVHGPFGNFWHSWSSALVNVNETQLISALTQWYGSWSIKDRKKIINACDLMSVSLICKNIICKSKLMIVQLFWDQPQRKQTGPKIILHWYNLRFIFICEMVHPMSRHMWHKAPVIWSVWHKSGVSLSCLPRHVSQQGERGAIVSWLITEQHRVSTHQSIRSVWTRMWVTLHFLTSLQNNHRLLRCQRLLPMSTMFSKQPATARFEWAVRGRMVMGEWCQSPHPSSPPLTVFLKFYVYGLGPVKKQ